MSPDDEMDFYKRIGFSVDRCLDCGIRLWGGSSSTHAICEKHRMVNEDSLSEETIKQLNQLRVTNAGTSR